MSHVNRILAAVFLTVAMLASSSCVTRRSGTATVDRGIAGDDAFRGIVEPSVNTSRHSIFMTHGMGPTEDTFGEPLLAALGRAGYSELNGVNPPWTLVPLANPIRLVGEGLSCTSTSVGAPCQYSEFGRYRVHHLTSPTTGRSIDVYLFYWDPELRDLQERYMANDDRVRRSSLASALKARVINYGFTDAAAYLGPLGDVLRASAEGAICAMVRDAATDRKTLQPQPACRFDELVKDGVSPDARFTFISESLGSRLLFDTLNPFYNRAGPCLGPDSQVKQAVIDRTDSFFMLANQLPLIALGQIQVDPTGAAPTACDGQVSRVLNLVSSRRGGSKVPLATDPMSMGDDGTLPPLQLVSFQDPEDLLGFKLIDALVSNPDDRLRVVEVNHRNTFVVSFFGKSGSNPQWAHAVELERESSTRLILCGARIVAGRKLEPKSDCFKR